MTRLFMITVVTGGKSVLVVSLIVTCDLYYNITQGVNLSLSITTVQSTQEIRKLPCNSFFGFGLGGSVKGWEINK